MFTFEKYKENVNKHTSLETKALLAITRPLFLFIALIFALLVVIVYKAIGLNIFIVVCLFLLVGLLAGELLKSTQKSKESFEALRNSTKVLYTLDVILSIAIILSAVLM